MSTHAPEQSTRDAASLEWGEHRHLDAPYPGPSPLGAAAFPRRHHAGTDFLRRTGRLADHRRFDLIAYRRQRFADGLFCPHCDARKVHRWGTFSGRRRYRCVPCGRTFSDLTGTPLAYLKRLDRWIPFCDCSIAAQSVRRTAEALGVHSSTAFRWRHRLLVALRAADSTMLQGDVAIAETWFPRSHKGSRCLQRPARRRGETALWSVERAWVLMAHDHTLRPFATVLGLSRPRAEDLARAMDGRLQPGITLSGVSGPLGAIACFARARGFEYRRLKGRTLVYNPAAVYGQELRRWLRRFNGVATKYLSNYLVWHRFLHAAEETGMTDLAASDRLLACAFP